MSELESKVTESNGDAVAPSSGDEPSPETISAAEALKLEGNALLAGEKGWAERTCIFRLNGGIGGVPLPLLWSGSPLHFVSGLWVS